MCDPSLTAEGAQPTATGLVYMWRRDIHYKVKVLLLEANVIAIELLIGCNVKLLLNVYIKSDFWEDRTLEMYLETLGKLEDILSSRKFENVYIMGEYNADPFIGRAWTHLTEFIEYNDLTCFYVNVLDSQCFTFVPFNNSNIKWLDHVVRRNSQNILIQEIDILYSMIGSDHLPVVATIRVTSIDPSQDVGVCDRKEMVDYFIDI